MSTLFVKRLTVIDFSYLDAARGLLGESWLVDIELNGNLDDQGMVLDFARVKKSVKTLIDEHFDHKLVIPQHYPGCEIESQYNRLDSRFTLNNGEVFMHSGPPSSCCLLDATAVTPETMSTAIIERLAPSLPDNVDDIRLRLYSEAIEGAYYHYSHGLKRHDGNCQRIAHGHRSKIIIEENGQRNSALEAEWATRWQDIYIASEQDLVEQFEYQGRDYLKFSYHACQGDFELSLPARHCYLLKTDTTVENLAEHIASELQRNRPETKFRVCAFEGVDKGAIGRSGD